MKIKNFITSIITIFVMGSLFCSINQQNGLNEQNININKAQSAESAPEEPKEPDFQIKMIDLKCDFGDSTLITYKDKHILIDAGGKSVSADPIYNSIKDLNYIDYMIFTHADEDHIYNFADRITSPFERWFLSNPKNKIGTIIDFDVPEISEIYKEKDKITGLEIIKRNYVDYKKYKDKLKQTGKLENYMNAKEAINGENKGFFSLDKEKPTNGFRILDNYFYNHNVPNLDLSAKRNNVSVCTLFEIDGYKHLFTGDLEEFQSQKKHPDEVTDVIGKPYDRIYGESFLAALNYQYLKDGVVFYKAGHHGSDTSNSSFFMDLIRPRYIGVSCAVTKFTSKKKIYFPGQVSLVNMAKWTDYIYFNDKFDETEDNVLSYYGDIILNYYSTKTDELSKFEFTSSLKKSNANLEGTIDPLLLDRRKMNMQIYSLGDESNGYGVYSEIKKVPVLDNKDTYESFIEKVKKDFIPNDLPLTGSIYQSNATYIKFGHIDILINLGSNDVIIPENNIKKVNKLCNDNRLEYLILSNNDESCYNNLVGPQGLLKTTTIKKIDNFYHFGVEGVTNDSVNATKVKSILNDKLIKNANVKTSSDLDGKKISILKNSKDFELAFNFYNMPFTNTSLNGETEPSYHNLMFTVTLTNKVSDKNKTPVQFTYANTGDLHDPNLLERFIANNNIGKVDIFDFMTRGYINDCSAKSLYSFKKANSKFGDPYLLYNGLMFKKEVLSKFKIYSETKLIPTSVMKSNGRGSTIEYVAGNIINRILFGPDLKPNKINFMRHLIIGSRDINYFSASLTSPFNIKYDRNSGDTFGLSLINRYLIER